MIYPVKNNGNFHIYLGLRFYLLKTNFIELKYIKCIKCPFYSSNILHPRASATLPDHWPVAVFVHTSLLSNVHNS